MIIEQLLELVILSVQALHVENRLPSSTQELMVVLHCRIHGLRVQETKKEPHIGQT